MNAAEEVNQSLNRSLFKAGVVIIAITVVIFLVKSVFGYTNVTKVDTFNDCKVHVFTEEIRSVRVTRGKMYFIQIDHKENKELDVDFGKIYEDPENYNVFKETEKTDSNNNEYVTIYSGSIPYWVYRKFRDYNSGKVTFYKTSWGRAFPVYNPSCGKAEAERVYRRLDPPVLWYILYIIGFGIGFSLIKGAKKSKRAADNYSDGKVYEAPFQFESVEDAMAEMARQRIRAEKQEMNMRRGQTRISRKDRF